MRELRGQGAIEKAGAYALHALGQESDSQHHVTLPLAWSGGAQQCHIPQAEH